MFIYYIPSPLTVHFPMKHSVRYQPILHTLYYTLHTEHVYCLSYRFLPTLASEQGNVIGSVRIYVYKKKIVIERTRDLIYLKFVVTDFFPKIISPSVGENSGDLA